MRYLLLTILIWLSTLAASAQTITGVVRDAQTREPLPGAVIRQHNTTNAVAARTDGTFSIDLSAAEPARLTVSHIGYKTETIRTADPRHEVLVLLLSDTIISDEILVIGHRVDDTVPVSYSSISGDEIGRVNLGKDMPVLMHTSPSVVSTSDAGAGVGYTSIRIRGIDDTRINVTINGIPLNDAESHGVFWVNMPDFASSVGTIQIQRGVGTSANGPASFGATVNIQTSALRPDAYGRVTSGAGSFNTWRNTLHVGTGLLPNGWALEGRLSAIQSDGFIDRATSDLSSWYVSASRYGKRDLLKVNLFSGRERTYQAWNGVPEARLRGDVAGMNAYADEHGLSAGERAHLLLSGNRTYNAYTYDNQVDRYGQDHAQLHYTVRLSDFWYVNTSLHYTRGSGYFEEFRPGDPLSAYNLADVVIGTETVTQSDLIRRRWLDNHFYGVVAATEYRASDRWQFTGGGGYNLYDGDHFGEVIWARIAPNADIRHRYYDNNGLKKDGNIYGKLTVFSLPELNLYLDGQVRSISYTFLGFDANLNDVEQTDRLTFFNPKAGLVYRLFDGHRAYLSYSVGNKEPTRREYTQSTPASRPSHETVYDLEVGYRAETPRWAAGINGYWMNYRNQLVLTGQVNDVGAYNRTNVDKSYRAGMEFDAAAQLTDRWQISGNITMSRNKIPEFTEYTDNFDTGTQAVIRHKNTDISFSPDLIGSVVLGYERLGFSGNLISKMVSRQYLDNTQQESRSLDAYMTTDLLLSYRMERPAVARYLEFTVQGFNLLNALYESNGYTYGWISGGEDKRFNFYYPQAGRHFMVQVQVGF